MTGLVNEDGGVRGGIGHAIARASDCGPLGQRGARSGAVPRLHGSPVRCTAREKVSRASAAWLRPNAVEGSVDVVSADLAQAGRVRHEVMMSPEAR